MSQILVRDLDPETVEQLKQRAARSRRSLQQEVRLILEQAARRDAGAMSRGDLLAEIDEIAAAAGPQLSDSADLIGEDRDR